MKTVTSISDAVHRLQKAVDYDLAHPDRNSPMFCCSQPTSQYEYDPQFRRPVGVFCFAYSSLVLPQFFTDNGMDFC